MIPMLIAVLTITFLLSHAMTINPLQSKMTLWDPQIYYDEMARLGLDQPIHIQFMYYFRDFFTGNWGESFSGKFQGWLVTDIIVIVLPRTLEMVFIPIFIIPIIAVKLGVSSAKNRKKNKDILIRSIAVIGAGFPSFWIAILLRYLFGIVLLEATFYQFDIDIIDSNNMLLDPSFPKIIPTPSILLVMVMILFSIIVGIYLIYRGNKLRKEEQSEFKKKNSRKGLLINIIFGVTSVIAFFMLLLFASSYILVFSIMTVILIVLIIALLSIGVAIKNHKSLLFAGILICIVGIVPIFLFVNTYGTKFRILDSIIFNDPLYLWDTIAHLLLPSLSMTLVSLAGITRQTRSSMLNVLDQDYIRTARAKGVPEKKIINNHALRNALIPTSNLIIGGTAIALLGSLFIERIFEYPGFGDTFFTSIMSGNIPLINGCVMVATIILLTSNLTADVMYTIIDPRIIYT
jgi:ABC-type dipeptide/oligopeptide/nickel transport system permease component